MILFNSGSTSEILSSKKVSFLNVPPVNCTQLIIKFYQHTTNRLNYYYHQSLLMIITCFSISFIPLTSMNLNNKLSVQQTLDTRFDH